MKLSTKILLGFLILGIIYSFYRAFTGAGGSGLYDFFDAIALTSIILFIVSFSILIFNFRRLKQHIATILFFIISLPITILSIKGSIESIYYNRTPDLTMKYPRPVNKMDFFQDSVNIKLQIDSLIAKRNRDYGGPDRMYALIDTIIYSQSGDQIFVSYVNKFEHNDLGNDLDPGFLSANKKSGKFWDLREGPPAAPNLGGSFSDFQTLKMEVRKYYFNQYLFADKDSNKVNYFWKKK